MSLSGRVITHRKLAALKTDDIQQMLSKATQKLAVLTRDVKRKSDQIDEKKVK